MSNAMVVRIMTFRMRHMNAWLLSLICLLLRGVKRRTAALYMNGKRRQGLGDGGARRRSSHLVPARRLDHTTLLMCSMPKLVPFLASWNGTSNIGIASRWSHLINNCGARAFTQVTRETTASPAGETT